MSILSKLAIKNMKFNKKRTTVSIIAITLSCMMIFMICFSFSTYRECQKQNIINLEGDYHVLVSNIKYESINNFDNEYIEKYLVYSNTKIKYNSEDEHFGDTLVKADINYLKNLNITSGRIPNNDKEILLNDENCIINNNIIINSSEYKIVGCIKSSKQQLYTLYEFDTKDDINVLLYYKNLKDLRSKTIQLVSDLPEIKNNPLLSGFAESKIEYNSKLLSYYGSHVDTTGILNNAFYNVIVLITCTIVGVFILLVVYNTYSISVIERKRSFAVLSSVGATKFQVIKTLMFEALIELLIGITLGFIISYGIFNIIIQVLNSIFYKNLVFNIHIPYLLICIAILLIFVLLSSIMPSIEASYINCISVIRGNNDIKNKKLKKSIFDFNIESSIAHKNIKINKRKYGATTFCIVLSFVLFTTFSIFFNLLNVSITDVALPNYDYEIVYEGDNIDLFLNKLIINGVKKSNVFRTKEVFLENSNNSFNNEYFIIYNLYKDYEKTYLSKEKRDLKFPIFINYTIKQNSKDNEIYEGKVTSEQHNSFNICNRDFNFEIKDFKSSNCTTISDLNYTTTIPFGIYIGIDTPNINKLIVNEDLFNKLSYSSEDFNNYYIYLNVKDIKSFDKHINSLKEEFKFNVFNQKLDNLEIIYHQTIIFIISFTALAFIVLFSIINIYNSISTNMNLRKREFAVLKSMGMNNKSFNKMIRLESIYFSLKSIIWGILLSLIIYLYLKIIYTELFSLQKMITKDAIFNFPLPLKYIIIASIILIFIVHICMKLSFKKENCGNIIDIIKEDIY